jgi:plastocyanin
MERTPMRLAIPMLVLALAAAACGGSGAGDDPTTTTGGQGATTTTAGQTTTTAGNATTTTVTDTTVGGAVELRIAAEDSEGFTKDKLEAPAGTEVTVIFQNKDVGGEPHNWRIALNPGVEEYATELAEGPDTQEVTFTIGVAGDYDYWCDTHIVEGMTGVLTATS